MKEKEVKVYEPPRIEVIEFELEDSIASSGDYGPNVSCGETTWGDGW